MTNIDWSKSPEGTTHYDNNSAVYNWIKKDNDDYYYESNNGAWSRWSPSEQTISNFFKKPIPVFTQKMADDYELPVVGMLFTTETGANYTIDMINKKSVVFIDEDGFLIGIPIGLVKPIDTRTDEEKTLDDLWDSYRTGEKIHFEKDDRPEITHDILRAIKENKIHGVKWVGNDEKQD